MPVFLAVVVIKNLFQRTQIGECVKILHINIAGYHFVFSNNRHSFRT